MRYPHHVIFLVFIIICSMVGCIAGIPVVKRASSGPDGVSLWKYRTYPYRTAEETEKYENELLDKVDAYLDRNPGLSDYIIYKLKVMNLVVEGMNKEMVELLYGKPNKIITDYSQLKYNATEKWIYIWNPGEERIFFDDNGIVIALEDKHYEPIVP